MTTNQERALALLNNLAERGNDDAVSTVDAVHELAAANLLAPDLPEPTWEHTDTWVVDDLEIETIGDSVHLEWPDGMDDMRGTTTRSLNLDRRMILAILAAAHGLSDEVEGDRG